MSKLSALKHHAILFVYPNRKEISESLWMEIKENSIANVIHEHTIIDIDTARKLITWANTPYEGEKTALVSFHTITIPAQNALLKIVEEPRNGVRFIFVTTNKDAIIPTLYSRMEEKKVETSLQENDASHIFLRTPHTERMKLKQVTEILLKVDEEGRKDREAVRMFILSLVPLLTRNKNSQKYTQETLEAASYAGDPSSSGKALLEYLSLLLPQLKD